ncbi:hypothetical protein NX362_000959 [Salmonella enterica]|nr:hypothetical protein [Salmonella enterica]
MSSHNYQLIKIYYPLVLIPLNPFILDIISNNCGCPNDYIAIYLLQDRGQIDKTKFFFNYSQALKEYKSKLKNEEKEVIIDESDLLKFQVDIDISFDYSTNIINDINLFKVSFITPHPDEISTNIEKELKKYNSSQKEVMIDIKQDSFNIYDKVRDGNIELKRILDSSELSTTTTSKRKLSF